MKNRIKLHQIEESTTHEVMRLTILPTEDCILKCYYCYESHMWLPRGHCELKPLSRDHIEGIKSLITQNAYRGLKMLILAWFGGEPLMCIDIIEEISQHALGLGLNVVGDATTNGVYLNLKNFKKLIKCNVLGYKISLDGAKEDHDKTRVSKSGKGTYDRIWSNLIAIKNTKEKFQISLRVHVHEKNFPRIEGFIELLTETFLDDDRFVLELEPIRDHGGDSVTKVKLLKLMEKGNKYFSIKIVGKRIRLENHLPTQHRVHIQKDKEPYVCYAAKPNSYVIRASGNIAKCTIKLEQIIGVLMNDGEMRFNKEKLEYFNRGWGDFKTKTINKNLAQLACPMFAP
ncbi:MAG: 4Fe-4S cluster-binding domain-containing protein [Candidatus Brocadiaceae bacterium]|nr:4Fe-4S cluster-binding domain-containing protein [Candidatus Brocadiaceae bacterium]